ncbi:MAG: hypothetical protein ABI837_09770 [Acidobacteriota bacterium]
MSRWGEQIFGLIMLAALLWLLFSTQRQLLELRQQRSGATSAPARGG